MVSDLPRVVVTVGGLLLIAGVLLFFFGPRR
jgi:uncharacterized membrane protein HdeD (DUF308 family)